MKIQSVLVVLVNTDAAEKCWLLLLCLLESSLLRCDITCLTNHNGQPLKVP